MMKLKWSSLCFSLQAFAIILMPLPETGAQYGKIGPESPLKMICSVTAVFSRSGPVIEGILELPAQRGAEEKQTVLVVA